MKYDAEYFIAKFEAIPEELWNDNGHYYDGEKRCAYGHCGKTSLFRDTPESEALYALSQVPEASVTVAALNDGNVYKYQQPTPKQRVLAWLRDAKKAGL